MRALNILHLEDDPNDAEIIQGVLAADGVENRITRVETRDDFIARLQEGGFDLILADLSLPSFDGMSALRIVAERRLDLPFIFVSGTLGEEVAIDALKIGATDYVLKDRLSRLASSVRRALREATERAELKQAEQQLRRSEAFLAEGQRISHTGSWGWVLSSSKVIWSEEQFRMLGYEPGSVAPSIDMFLAAVHVDDRAQVREVLETSAAAKRAYAVDYRVPLPDGSIRHLRSVGRPVAPEAGEIDEYIGISADVTERVEGEAALIARHEELRRMEAQLRHAQRLESMGTLAGGIAHDFNNILGAILGYGERALQDAARGTRLRRDLESILAAGERGRALVDRVLTFTRSSVGERVAVHVEGVVREALDLIEAKLPEGVVIETELHAGRAAMQGDPTQIHQVLMNLATNAIHAMPSGGTLRIELRVAQIDEERAATLGSILPGDCIVLKVTDTGTGIAPEILDRIFDPFFTTKEVGVGTGLGLSLVHGIVMEVGGAIEVASTPGAGSAFVVYLPRAGEANDTAELADQAVPQGDGQRVLFVDDEEPLVRLATETLEELGYAPMGFTSSAVALEAFRADPKGFDAVITDERMPGMSGSALIREVRNIRDSVPIVLVSGYVGGTVSTGAWVAGANEVLKKPLSARELAISLARVLRE